MDLLRIKEKKGAESILAFASNFECIQLEPVQSLFP